MHVHIGRTFSLFLKAIRHCVLPFFKYPVPNKKGKERKEKKRKGRNNGSHPVLLLERETLSQ